MKVRVLSGLLVLCLVLTFFPIAPIAAAQDDPLLQLPTDYNVSCDLTWSLETLDGSVITQDTYSDRTQVLIFCNAGDSCWNSNNTISTLVTSDWIKGEDIQVIIIDGNNNSRETVAAYKQAYAPDCEELVFALNGNQLLFRFLQLVDLGNTYAFNYIVDDGQIRYAWAGSYKADYYTGVLSLLHPDIKNDADLSLYSFDVSGICKYDEAYEVLEIVNAARAEEGLNALTMDAQLLEAAMQRAAELTVYYSHFRPDATDCFTAFPESFQSGVSIRENIAVGQTDAQDVMESWMGSPGHRANILGENNQSIGVGCFFYEGRLHWVQLFAGKTAKPEETPTTDSRQETKTITAAGSLFDLNASLEHVDLAIGETRAVSLTIPNANPDWPFFVSVRPTSLRVVDPAVAQATVVGDFAEITGLQSGSTTLEVGLIPTSGGEPKITEIILTVCHYGDVDANGKVNTTDARKVLQYAANMIAAEEIDLAAADMDRNRRVNTTDARRILQHVAGLLS